MTGLRHGRDAAAAPSNARNSRRSIEVMRARLRAIDGPPRSPTERNLLDPVSPMKVETRAVPNARDRTALLISVLGTLTIAVSCRPVEGATTQEQPADSGAAPAMRADPPPADDGQWVRPGKDYQGT